MTQYTEMPLTQQAHNKAIHITQDDMLHIVWKHATIRMNVTGLIYLLRYLNGTLTTNERSSHFEITGTPDDGYQLWIQDIGLRLSPDDYRSFKQLLTDGMLSLQQRQGSSDAKLFSGEMMFTMETLTRPNNSFSLN